jgi:hypothetical protein
MSREREGPKGFTGRFGRGQFGYVRVETCNCGSTVRETKNGFAWLESMVTLLNACSKIPVALFGTPLRGAVKSA